MAMSQTSGNYPLIMDSAGQGIDRFFYVKKFRYVGSTAVGNECIVHDYDSGGILFDAYANGSFCDIESDFTGLVGGCLRADGLKLTTLGAGKLYVYYAP